MSRHKKTVGGEKRRKRTFTDVWCTHASTCQLCFPKKDISAYLLLQSSRHAPFGACLNQEQKPSPLTWNQVIWSFQLSGMMHIKTGSIKTHTPPLKLNHRAFSTQIEKRLMRWAHKTEMQGEKRISTVFKGQPSLWVPLGISFYLRWASLVAQMMKNVPAIQETRIWSLGQEDPLEKRMATFSRSLAWRIPWTEEPGGLQSLGSQRVRYNWTTDFLIISFPFPSLFVLFFFFCFNLTQNLL